MFLTIDYITLGVIALGVVLLVAERAVKKFGKCEKKDNIALMLHDLRELFLEMSSKSESTKTSSDEAPDPIHVL